MRDTPAKKTICAPYSARRLTNLLLPALAAKFLGDAIHYLGQSRFWKCDVKTLSKYPRVIPHDSVKFSALTDCIAMLRIKHHSLQQLENGNAISDKARCRDYGSKLRFLK